MIDPPRGMSGTSEARITIRALNDGQVLIDGQFAREPLRLVNNDRWVIEGINFKNGSASVGILRDGSSNNILRRLVLWDAPIASTSPTFQVILNSNNNLIEDVAVFGTGRKPIFIGHGANNNTCRRCWARWEGSIAFNIHLGVSIVYSSFGNICENCLATWSDESMPQQYEEHDSSGNSTGALRTNFAHSDGAAGQALGSDHMQQVTNKCANAKILGSIAYQKATDLLPRDAPNGSVISNEGLVGIAGISCVEVRDTIAVIATAHPDFDSPRRGFNMRNTASGAAPTNMILADITSIRSATGGDQFTAQWTVTNASIGTSLAAVANPWTSPLSAPGANLCHRYVNGIRTMEPLWPWPMNERIKAATATAGAYSGPCPTCVGGGLHRTATDVTADIERLLGPIPPACRR